MPLFAAKATLYQEIKNLNFSNTYGLLREMNFSLSSTSTRWAIFKK